MKRLEIEKEINEINKEFGLVEENGIVTTTSLKVAEIYGKEHKNVIAKIKNYIELIPELAELNFKPSEYTDCTGRKLIMYQMDRQGFSMLVNKFTGDEATIFTYKYTKAFERMIELIELLSQENIEIKIIPKNFDIWTTQKFYQRWKNLYRYFSFSWYDYYIWTSMSKGS